jgi:hypothetical protein
MIRLTDLLNEISLASVVPYATQFVWRDNWGDKESFECKFEADSQPITMTMTKWKSSRHGDDGEWQFAYFVRTSDSEGWTTTTRQSAARGQLNVFRLFKTLGEAIRDFANTQQGVDVIDITGSDTYDVKGAQKNNIYIEFLRTNPDLREFNILADGRHVYLIRKTKSARAADSTGIEDTDDYWTPDGSEESTDGASDWRHEPDGTQSARF